MVNFFLPHLPSVAAVVVWSYFFFYGGGFLPWNMLLKIHRTSFHTFPSQLSRTLRRSHQRWETFSNSGFQVMLSMDDSVMASWSYTQPDHCVSLDHQWKPTDALRNIWWHIQVSVFCSLAFFLQIKNGSCIMTRDQMTSDGVNISSISCTSPLMLLCHEIPCDYIKTYYI